MNNRLLALALFCSVPSSSCAHQVVPLPAIAAPAVSAREDPIPSQPTSAMAIPIAIPLAELTQLMRERMVIPNVTEWRQVTESDHSPELSIRYTAELLDPRIGSEGQTMHITLPVAYYGSFKARVKSPFGWIWLTKGTDWGDAERRGLIEVDIASQLDLSNEWQLTSHTSLVDVRLTAPPISKLCTSGAFKLCVPADMATERVHRELDARVREKVASGLVEVDEQVARRANLNELARAAWAQLNAAGGARWNGESLAIVPQEMTLSYPVVQGDTLQAELRVWGMPRWSNEPPPPAPPFPWPTHTEWHGNDVHLNVRISRDAFSNALTSSTRGLPPLPSKHKLDKLTLLGAAAQLGHWLMAATFVDEEQSFTLYFDVELPSTPTHLLLQNIQLLGAPDALLNAARVRGSDVVQLLSQAQIDLSGPIGEQVDTLRHALAGAVTPWPTSALNGLTPMIEGIYATGGDVLLSMHLR